MEALRPWHPLDPEIAAAFGLIQRSKQHETRVETALPTTPPKRCRPSHDETPVPPPTCAIC